MGLILSDDELDAHDIIVDIVINEWDVVGELTGLGDFGEFPIYICNYGPAFWVFAPEFGTEGYFRTIEEAQNWAESNYEPSVTRYYEERGEKD